MKSFLLGLLYCIIVVALFFAGEALFNGGFSKPAATAEGEQITFDNEDDLQAYIEDHYAADQSEVESQFEYLYDAGRSDGRQEGYEEGYRDGYQAGYEDGANGAEYWEP